MEVEEEQESKITYSIELEGFCRPVGLEGSSSMLHAQWIADREVLSSDAHILSSVGPNNTHVL